MLDSEFVNEYSFFFALIVVFFLARFIAGRMPHILAYEKMSEMTRIMEPAYVGDVKRFRRELGGKVLIDGVWAIYLIVTVVSLLFSLQYGNTLFILVIFALFAWAAVKSSVKFSSAYFALRKNPTPEQCVDIVDNAYGLDYAAYYEAHQGQTVANMLPPVPRRYKAYLIVSIVTAAICALLGSVMLTFAMIVAIASPVGLLSLFMGMNFLYASVAIYFGVKDLISSIASLKALKRA